jgi:predicted nucleic acid-binding protein
VTIIPDASLIVPLLIDEDNSLECQELMRQSPHRIHLDFTLVEVSNSLRNAVVRNRISGQRAAAAFKELKVICDNPINASQYLESAYALALAINHPIYDCLYAVAARENKATLITCDAKFAAKLDPQIFKVHVL